MRMSIVKHPLLKAKPNNIQKVAIAAFFALGRTLCRVW